MVGLASVNQSPELSVPRGEHWPDGEVCMLVLEKGNLGRKEAPLPLNDRIVLDHEYCRYEPATKLLSTSAEMCFHCSEGMDDWAETGCCFDSATRSSGFFLGFFLLCCSWAPRNADLQGCLYFDVQIHSSTSWRGIVNRNRLNVQGSPWLKNSQWLIALSWPVCVSPAWNGEKYLTACWEGSPRETPSTGKSPSGLTDTNCQRPAAAASPWISSALDLHRNSHPLKSFCIHANVSTQAKSIYLTSPSTNPKAACRTNRTTVLQNSKFKTAEHFISSSYELELEYSWVPLSPY